jgi:hypothetical protein
MKETGTSQTSVIFEIPESEDSPNSYIAFDKSDHVKLRFLYKVIGV